jgi:hypothetical protein
MLVSAPKREKTLPGQLMTDQTLQLLLKRLDHLTAEFQELREGVMKAVRISDDDPEMALTRARKVLEYVVRDVFALRCQEDPGTRPLENILQRLVKDGHLPKRLGAYASYIRDLGNVGTHVYGEDLSKEDVRRSFENLTSILEWYFERVRPDAFMKVEAPVREEMDVRRYAEEETRLRDEERERKSREAEELKRREAEEARVEVKEPAQTTPSGVSESLNRLVERQEEKAPLIAPPSSPPTAWKIYALGIVCLIGGVLGVLGHIGGVLAPIAFLLGLLLIGIQIGRQRGSKKKPGMYAENPAPLSPPAHKLPGAFRGTLSKMILSAICGFVAGAVAAPFLSFPLHAEVVLSALLVGVLHGLVIGLILIPGGKGGKVVTSLAGLIIGIVVGLVIQGIIASLFQSHHWYMHSQDGLMVEFIGGGSLGFVLGAIHGSKKTAR